MGMASNANFSWKKNKPTKNLHGIAHHISATNPKVTSIHDALGPHYIKLCYISNTISELTLSTWHIYDVSSSRLSDTYMLYEFSTPLPNRWQTIIWTDDVFIVNCIFGKNISVEFQSKFKLFHWKNHYKMSSAELWVYKNIITCHGFTRNVIIHPRPRMNRLKLRHWWVCICNSLCWCN